MTEINSVNLIKNYLLSQSYQVEYRDLMNNMLDKYGSEMFNLSGIGRQLDMNNAIKKMVNANSVANGSIDSNANAGYTTAITIMHEIAKPQALMQSYYRIWKWLKKNRNLETANSFVEAQLTGAFYVNDMHYISYPMPYSYYGKSVIIVKYKGQILYINYEDLFNMFSENVEVLPDRDIIDLSNINIQVLDQDNKFIKLTHILRHKPHCGLLKFETKNGYTTIVTKDHPVILDDGSEKQACDVSIGDKLMVSNNKLEIFDSKCYEVNRLKYIIGFLIGDGYVNKPREYHVNYQCTITQKELRNHKVYDYIKSEVPESLNNIHVDKNEQGKESVTFGNKCWTCKNAQINYGAQNKILPKDILNWDRNEILSLIAGLIDSDGCVTKPSGVVDIRITAFSVVQQVAELLRALGFQRVRTSLIEHQERNYQYRYNYDMYRVSFVVNKENEDLINFSDKLSVNKDIILRERGVGGRYETNEVLKIQEFEEEQEYVYDITTETGHFHCQGLIQHNCYNHSCLNIAMQGLVGIDSKNDTKPPKYLRSYFDIVEAYLLIAGNATAGATGISNLLVVASIFLKKMINNNYSDSHVKLASEEDCWLYFKEELTSFIYKLNQPCRGNQSLFSNVSIYDKNFLDGIIAESQLVIDGELYGTDLETVQRCQKIYIDVMNEEAKRVVHTFPVTTACISTKYNEELGKNEILDPEFLSYICEQNEKTGFINIYGGDTATLSSCCFDGKQLVLTKSSDGIELKPIKEIIEGPWKDLRRNFTVFHNGSWVSAKIVKLEEKRQMYKVVTSNNKEILVTDNHLNLTQRGDVATSDLTTNDYLAFNTRSLDSFPEKDQKLTYEQGFLIGMYAGDGSKYKHKDSESYEIVLSLNEKKIKNLPLLYKALEDWNINKEIHVLNPVNNCIPVHIYSKQLFDIINEYVLGDYCYNKEFNINLLCQSQDFRKGIIDGWEASDGDGNRRIYTSSINLLHTGEAIFTSLGINTKIIERDQRDSGCIIKGVKYNSNYVVYCIRYYDSKNKRGMGDDYKVRNNTGYFKIKSIEPYNSEEECVYCFDVQNDFEPYFTLPNGIITHNCRLRSDKNNVFFNSFGGASDSIGSMGVVCVNLPQLAFKYKDDINKFKEKLHELVLLAQEVNYAKRCLLKTSINKGHLPLYTNNYMDLTKQFSTLGFVGLYNACEILGHDITTDEGLEVAKNILSLMEKYNDEVANKYKIPTNMEGIPAENTAIKLAKKDKLLKLNDRYDLYSNQFIPLSVRCNLLDRIRLSSEMDKYCSGGSIMHVTVDGQINKKTMSDLATAILESGVKYFAFNYEINQCKSCEKIFTGKHSHCPECGNEDIERYMRIVGFLTKKSQWSHERAIEDRQYYTFQDELVLV